jgi:predicted  nucleic acid-binding Zn-ribbon protein
MTIHRCIGCGCELVKPDGSQREIRGLCPECAAQRPRLVEKLAWQATKKEDKDAWRRY